MNQEEGADNRQDSKYKPVARSKGIPLDNVRPFKNTDSNLSKIGSNQRS